MDEHVGDRLTAYVDGALSAEETAAVAAHLAVCAHCCNVRDDLLAIRRVLRAVPAPLPSPSLLPRTLARLDATDRRRVLFRQAVIAAAVAAVAAVALQVPVPRALETAPPSVHLSLQRHAEAAMQHPLGDTTLAGYLGSALPYFVLGTPEETGGRL
jgi:anti-sigma factor RsiW